MSHPSNDEHLQQCKDYKDDLIQELLEGCREVIKTLKDSKYDLEQIISKAERGQIK